jgi:hypothetical protein
MNVPLQIGGVLLLAAAVALGAQKGNPKPPKPPPPPAAKPAAPRAAANANTPKAGTPKTGGAAVTRPNPVNQFERLIAMPPEKRDQVLERLPPAQQERLRQRLDQFDKLPPQQKAERLQLANRYFALPPEKQAAFAQQVQAYHGLERDRHRAVQQELRTLWQLPEAQREARLNSDDVKTRFSPAELQMLSDLSSANVLHN